jgi:type I restriction enzyme S subunit
MSNDMKLIPELRFPEFKSNGSWKASKIGSFAKVSAGGTPSSNEPKYWGGEIPWMNSGELNLKRVYDVENRITELGLKESSTKKIPSLCVLIGLAGQGKTRGTAAINYIELCSNQSIAAIHPNQSKFDSEFLFQKVDSLYQKLRRLSTGQGGRGGLNLTIIREIQIPLPSLDEQQKIASCLSTLDELIAAHNDKLDALKDHKKGLLQNLFPQEGETVPKVRFPEFEGDGEWVEKKLGEVAEINRGKSKHRPRNASFLYGGKYPFIQTGDIREAGLYLSEFNQTYSEAGLAQSKLWSENTLCVTIAANIAETTILKIKACFPDSVIGIVPKAQMTTVVFLHYQFELFKTKVQGQAQGVAQANLNQKKLSEIAFSFPPTIQEQQKIASCLSAVDDLITAQQEKIEQLQQHKKGLMQGLFPKIES